jgi:hypothetical protein
MNRKLFAAFALAAFAFMALGASIYHAATTPWSVGEFYEPKAVTQQSVWNKVNPPDVSMAVIESAGPGGHVFLKLSGVHATENIDNVQVFFDVAAALQDGSVKYARNHVASIVLESKAQTGIELKFDVTEYFSRILSHEPKELRNFTVEFVQVPKNNGVKQNDQSFYIDWTYLEITDAKGKPVAQEKREPRYG